MATTAKLGETDKPVRKRGRPRSEGRLEEVLACAATLFSQRGYAATGLEEIAAQLGMTRAALYYYAESKEDLLWKCYRWNEGSFLTRIRNELGEGNGRELLTRFFLIYAEQICGDASRCFLASEDHYLAPEAQEQVAKGLRIITNQGMDLLKRGIEDGSIAPCDPKYAMMTLFGAFNSLHKQVRPKGPSPREMGEGILKVVMDGIGPR